MVNIGSSTIWSGISSPARNRMSTVLEKRHFMTSIPKAAAELKTMMKKSDGKTAKTLFLKYVGMSPVVHATFQLSKSSECGSAQGEPVRNSLLVLNDWISIHSSGPTSITSRTATSSRIDQRYTLRRAAPDALGRWPERTTLPACDVKSVPLIRCGPFGQSRTAAG